MRFYKKIIITSTIVVFFSIFILSYSSIDNLKCQLGYPFSYLTIYNNYDVLKQNKFILSIISINTLTLTLNIIIVYIIFLLIKNIFSKIMK